MFLEPILFIFVSLFDSLVTFGLMSILLSAVLRENKKTLSIRFVFYERGRLERSDKSLKERMVLQARLRLVAAKTA